MRLGNSIRRLPGTKQVSLVFFIYHNESLNMILLCCQRPCNSQSSSRFPVHLTPNGFGNDAFTFADTIQYFSKLNAAVGTDRDRIFSDGLEPHMALYHNVRSQFGIQHRSLPHSLLWQAIAPGSERIHANMPSWSWMTISGEIRYAPVATSGLVWNTDIQLIIGEEPSHDILAAPLARSRDCNIIRPGSQLSPTVLKSIQFAIVDSDERLLGWISCDSPDFHSNMALECVLVAEAQIGWKEFTLSSWDEDLPEGKFFYTLIVDRAPLHLDFVDTYERIGVAIIHEDLIDFDAWRPTVWVV